jgi:hypothetical protein
MLQKSRKRKEILNLYIYNLLIKRRVVNKRTNLGNMYFEQTYTNKTITVNANTTWFIK